MAMQFPNSTPMPRQNPYPNEPQYGNVYQDLGKGLRQTGGDVDQFKQEMDQEQSRQDKMAVMVQRRKDAMAVQRAKEDWMLKDAAFAEAKVNQAQTNFETGVKADADEATLTAEYRKSKNAMDEAERKRNHEYRLAMLKMKETNIANKKSAGAKAQLSRNYPQYVKRELDRIMAGTPREEVMARLQSTKEGLMKNIGMAEQIISGDIETTSGDTRVYDDTMRKSNVTLGRIQEVIDAIALEIPDEGGSMSQPDPTPEKTWGTFEEYRDDPDAQLLPDYEEVLENFYKSKGGR